MPEPTHERLGYFKRLYPYIRQSRKQFAAMAALKVWALLLSMLPPLLYLHLVNDILVGGRLSLLVLVVGGNVAVYVLETLGISAGKVCHNKLFFKFRVSVRRCMLTKYTRMDAAGFSHFFTGDFKYRLEGDAGTAESFFTTHILDYFYAIASAVIITGIMLYLNWILALTGLVMVPLSFWFTRIMGKKVRRVSEEKRALNGEYESFLHNTFQNWKEIKANNLENAHNEILQDYRKKLSRVFVINQVYWYINRSFIAFKDFFITKMNLYFIGGLLIIGGRTNVGILLAFMNYYGQFFENITVITDSVLGLKKDAPNIGRMLEILEYPIEKKPFIRDLPNEIRLLNVCFKYYDDQPYVLNDISLRVMDRDSIALVGRSGSGKSTLAKIMMGLYPPVSGELFIGDYNLRDISFECVAKKIGIVMQEPPLFNLTIRENLLFANRNASDGELLEACKRANIYDFVFGLPDKLDTVIGERGIKLSGGQKQRLSIARTILQDPDIIIFDEATSALDSENEKAIITAIAELSDRKTVVTIAHRLSAIVNCRDIILLENGSIAGRGSHEALRGRNRLYDLLFEKQYQTGLMSDLAECGPDL